MRVTKWFLCLALFCIMSDTACSNAKPDLNANSAAELNAESTDELNAESIKDSDTEPVRDMGELYSLALDAYMPIDEGLNGGMKYIAIDMSNFKELDDTDKAQILAHFQTYNVDVMESTYEQLIAKGLYDPQTKALNGVLLRVEKTELSDKKMIVEGSKHRSAKGAVGIKVVVEYKNDMWQVTKADSTWIS